jgi:hypothetical protein
MQILMPARTSKIRHDENTRAKIQAGNIITRLMKFIEGEIKMEAAQVTAALGLLKKSLPDLTSVEHSGEVAISKVIRAPAVVSTAQEWAQQHIPEQVRH